MLKYVFTSTVVILALAAFLFLKKSDSKDLNTNKKPAPTEKPSAKKEQTVTTNTVIPEVKNTPIQKTEKEMVKTIEEAPLKIEPSDRMKKIRTEDGHVMLYDKDGRIIKKETPDGKIELYNYTREGERILVEK